MYLECLHTGLSFRSACLYGCNDSNYIRESTWSENLYIEVQYRDDCYMINRVIIDEYDIYSNIYSIGNHSWSNNISVDDAMSNEWEVYKVIKN